MRIISILIFIVLFPIISFSQLGGNSTYAFLNLPLSARIAASGGSLTPVWDDDINLTIQNPSLLNSSMSNQFVLNYVNYFSDIKYGGVSYAKRYDKYGNFSAGVMNISYGDFIEADQTGAILGTFSATETVFNVMWSKPIDSLFQFGVNLKGIISSLEKYQSFGVAADVGVTYHNKSGLFATSLVIKNFGKQLTTYYTEGNTEPLPMNVQLGFSKRLNHAPFRFSVVFQHLEKFDMSYASPISQNEIIDPITGEAKSKNRFADVSEKMFNHLILVAEFIPSKNFFATIAYNAQRRSEMSISTKSGTVGFSLGIGVNISKFRFSFGHARYHLAGASNHFTLSTDLSKFYKRKN